MKWTICIFLGLICHVIARRMSTRDVLRKYRQGPNVCVVQQAHGTNDKWFLSCFGGKYMRMVCERPTYMNFQCCSGYHRIPGQRGCTGVSPVVDIVETAEGLKQTEFVKHVQRAGLENQLATGGAYTVFVPTNDAFKNAPKDVKNSLEVKGEGSPLLYHVVPGRVNITELRRGTHEYNTLYKDERVLINAYAFGVTTVNCARVHSPDELATNGIVHVIDGVLKPLEAEGTLAEKILEDDDFSQFQLALFASNMVNELRREDKDYTVLAPTNKAFAQLPSELLDAIMTDADTAENVIKNHIIEGVYCQDAVVIAMGLKTMADTRVMMKCKKDGVYFRHAKVIDGDILASNGVAHAIDQVIVPVNVKRVAEVARKLRLNTLMDLAEKSNTDARLHGMKDFTLLAPTDEAFEKLPSKYLAALRTQPLAMERFMDYHTLDGRVTSDKLVGDQDINTNLGLSAKINVQIYRGGVAVNNAKIVDKDWQCGNGVIHRIDTVLIPPEDTLMDHVMADPKLSTLRQAVETAGLSQLLSQEGQFTLLAPTNNAFQYMSRRNLDQLLTNPKRLKKFLERHIINRIVRKCSIPTDSVYTIKSRQGDKTVLSQDRWKVLRVQKRTRIEEVESIATNGVMYKIDDTLKCSCEPRIR